MRIREDLQNDPYTPYYDWPQDCFVQWGRKGVVLKPGSMKKVLEKEDPIKAVANNVSYTTAFFEAFPKNPSTFIRGEGKTVEDAEKEAFYKLQKYLTCPEHVFERRGYVNGGGFCKYCGMFSGKAFDPQED